MRRLVIIALNIFLITSIKFVSFAQDDSSYVRTERKEVKVVNKPTGREDVTPLSDKVFIGFYPGFSWSNYGFTYEISPLAGIDITPKFSVGAGVVYKHSDSKSYYTNQGYVSAYKANFIGGRGFAFFDVYKGFCAYAEYEGVNIDYKSDAGTFQKWQTAVKVGLLYKSPLGERASLNFVAAYNLLYDNYETIGNPLDVRIGFVFYPFKSKAY